jgi:hypothetical protein
MWYTPLYSRLNSVRCSPEGEHEQEPEERRGSNTGAAEVNDALPPRLPFLPGRLPPDKLVVPQLGRRLGAAPPPRGGHRRGDDGQAVAPAEGGAVGVLDAQADLPDVAAALVEGDGRVERDPGGAAERDGEARDGVAGEPAPVDGHRAAGGGVDGAAGGGVEEDPGQREAVRRERRRRREALLHERVDAEGGTEEPGGGGVRLHHARHDAGAPLAEVDGGDEARGEGGGGAGRGGRQGREWVRVSEELPVGGGGGAGCAGDEADGVAQRRPPREAERAPRVRVGHQVAERAARAPERGQRRAVQPAEHQRQHVRGEVLDGRRVAVREDGVDRRGTGHGIGRGG